MFNILQNYYEKCGTFVISEENDVNHGHNITYIYTERFHGHSLFCDQTQFDFFPDDLKQLYKITFGDEVVMTYYSLGKPYTIEKFETIVKNQSKRVQFRNPFSAFIMYSNETDLPVGYEIIGNGNKERGEKAGILAKAYHNSETNKYCGFENGGALIWGYGYNLFKKRAFVNQVFNETNQKFEGDDIFKGIEATARTDNFGSFRMLRSLGFRELEIFQKFDHERYRFDLEFDDRLTIYY